MKHAIPNFESNFDRPDGKYWIKVYETALERLAALRADRDILDARLEQMNSEIVRFEKVCDTLKPLASEGIQMASVVPTVEGIEGFGLADACREILKQNPQYRTARGIRDSLIGSGYDITQHTNPLASVHSILKRLAEKGDVEELESEGKTRYRWKNTAGRVRGSDAPPILTRRPQTPEEAALAAEKRDLEELERRLPPLTRNPSGRIGDLKAILKKKD